LKPVGLFGGTFDPIHLGHLRLAEELGEALGLECVRLMPTGTPPHRSQPCASSADRLAMVRLAIADNPRFQLDEREIHRTRPCYMVDTLTELRAELGPERPVVLFLGADAFAGLESWHDWTRLFDLTHFAIAERPGYSLERAMPPALKAEFAARLCHTPGDLATTAAGRLYHQAITQLDISASLIRKQIASGRSPRYLLPDSVLKHIESQQLYR
jgi:nicotinate-nucleotide adenylyltransferase